MVQPHPLNQTDYPEASMLRRQNRFMDAVDQQELMSDLAALVLAAKPAFDRLRSFSRIRKRFDRSVKQHRGTLLYIWIKQRGSNWAKNSEQVHKILSGTRWLSISKRDLILRRLQNRVNADVSVFNLKVLTSGLPMRAKRFAQSLSEEDRFELLAPYMGKIAPYFLNSSSLYKAYRSWAAGQLINSCFVLCRFADKIRNKWTTPKACRDLFKSLGGTSDQWDHIRRYAGSLKSAPDAATVVAAIYAASGGVSLHGELQFDLQRSKWILLVWNAGRRAGLPSQGALKSLNPLQLNGFFSTLKW